MASLDDPHLRQVLQVVASAQNARAGDGTLSEVLQVVVTRQIVNISLFVEEAQAVVLLVINLNLCENLRNPKRDAVRVR